MDRRTYLRGTAAALTAATSGLAGCSESDPSTTATEGGTTPTATDTETPTPTATATPTPGDRSLQPYPSWLVTPTEPTPHTYEFTHLSLSSVRADADPTFAEQLDTYWEQRAESYFGVGVPVEDIDTVLTVNHSTVANESFRVLGGGFDPGALRPALYEVGFEADGRVDDFQRFVRTAEGRTRAFGLHPDVIVTISASEGAATPLETAIEQHEAGEDQTEADEGLAALIDHFGEADYLTGRELEAEFDEEFPLNAAVATGRRLDVQGETTWSERTYVFDPEATVDRAGIEEGIRRRHVGQPIEEYTRDGRIVTVAGEVENSLIRLL
jgi:hypothetical protein